MTVGGLERVKKDGDVEEEKDATDVMEEFKKSKEELQKEIDRQEKELQEKKKELEKSIDSTKKYRYKITVNGEEMSEEETGRTIAKVIKQTSIDPMASIFKFID